MGCRSSYRGLALGNVDSSSELQQQPLNFNNRALTENVPLAAHNVIMQPRSLGNVFQLAVLLAV